MRELFIFFLALAGILSLMLVGAVSVVVILSNKKKRSLRKRAQKKQDGGNLGDGYGACGGSDG